MCLKRKNVEREKKNDRPVSAQSKTTSLLFLTEGMVSVFAYLETCWPDLWKKKLEVFLLSEMIIGRKKKWNFPR